MKKLMNYPIMSPLNSFLMTIFLSLSLHASQHLPRLLICVDPQAEFTAQDLSQKIKAVYLDVEQKNPYKTLLPICLDHAVVCITFEDKSPLIKTIRRLAHRCGYRYLNLVTETLSEAVEKTRLAIASSPKQSSEIYHLSILDSVRLYELQKSIDQVLTSAKLTYWAGRGTLLGAVRHQGIMPWEDYHVLHILAQDEDRFKALEEAFNNVGLAVYYSVDMDFYKIFPIDGSVIPDLVNPDQVLPFRFPVTDLYVMDLECRHEAEDTYVHRSAFHFKFWNTENFTWEQIQKIQRVPFGPNEISIPYRPELTLNQIYGMPQQPFLWKSMALEPFWDHRIEGDHSWPGNALVEVDDFSPAPWN